MFNNILFICVSSLLATSFVFGQENSDDKQKILVFNLTNDELLLNIDESLASNLDEKFVKEQVFLAFNLTDQELTDQEEDSSNVGEMLALHQNEEFDLEPIV
jgi:hypothetical protein